MPSTAKERVKGTKTRMGHPVRRSPKVNADSTIRRIGDEWARHWNAGELDGVVAAYAEDAVYLPPHHVARLKNSRLWTDRGSTAQVWRSR